MGHRRCHRDASLGRIGPPSLPCGIGQSTTAFGARSPTRRLARSSRIRWPRPHHAASARTDPTADQTSHACTDRETPLQQVSGRGRVPRGRAAGGERPGRRWHQARWRSLRPAIAPSPGEGRGCGQRHRLSGRRCGRATPAPRRSRRRPHRSRRRRASAATPWGPPRQPVRRAVLMLDVHRHQPARNR
jgi:hypothetical protein